MMPPTAEEDLRNPSGTEPDQIAHFKYLTEVLLPQRARELRWPLRLDHCFKRVCLDHAFADVWYKHLAKPAERHLTGAPLARALACAEELAAGDAGLLAERNRASLGYRGKLKQPAAPRHRTRQEVTSR